MSYLLIIWAFGRKPLTILYPPSGAINSGHNTQLLNMIFVLIPYWMYITSFATKVNRFIAIWAVEAQYSSRIVLSENQAHDFFLRGETLVASMSIIII